MKLFKKITAVALSLSLVLGLLPSLPVKAASEQHGRTFDCPIGSSVTYYVQGAQEPDELIANQWALYNDGSFTLTSGANDHDVYDDPFGTPSLPGEWTDPFDDLFDSFFGRGYFWGFAAKNSSISQTNAVAGIDINIAEARTKYSSAASARDVIVAVIDTGIDYSHEDLKDSMWINEDEIPDNGIDDDGNGYIDDVYGWNFYDDSNQVFTGKNDNHGTHCAGTIAASTDNGTGIASVTGGTHVKVMSLKALGGSEGTGETISVVQAIKYAEANGASIVNLSFGCSYSDELLYNTIAASPLLFVVAAGNRSAYSSAGSNTDRNPCYPASYDLDNIISVANISYDGTLSSSSNYGAASVDLGAPGAYIISTTPGNDYGYMTGTSMAAPFVTGAAALIYSYFEDITLKDVKSVILGSTHELDSLTGKTVTGGMLDVSSAFSYDVTTLSHEEFKTAEVKGSAPELQYTASRRNGKIYITVTVTDPDRDIYGLFYSEGRLTASDFKFGAAGTSFKLKNSSSASFVTTEAGVYTFYAFDSEGNEAVVVVDLTEMGADGISGSSTQTPDSDTDANKDTGNDTGKDTGKDAGKDTGKDADKDTGKDTGKDTSDPPVNGSNPFEDYYNWYFDWFFSNLFSPWF